MSGERKVCDAGIWYGDWHEFAYCHTHKWEGDRTYVESNKTYLHERRLAEHLRYPDGPPLHVRLWRKLTGRTAP